MSSRRPSNASNSVTAPRSPMSGVAPSTSTMGSRRRAAAMASPSLVCAFSRTRSASSSAWKVRRSTIAGVPSSSLMVFIVRLHRPVIRVQRVTAPPVPSGAFAGTGRGASLWRPGNAVSAHAAFALCSFPHTARYFLAAGSNNGCATRVCKAPLFPGGLFQNDQYCWRSRLSAGKLALRLNRAQ